MTDTTAPLDKFGVHGDLRSPLAGLVSGGVGVVSDALTSVGLGDVIWVNGERYRVLAIRTHTPPTDEEIEAFGGSEDDHITTLELSPFDEAGA